MTTNSWCPVCGWHDDGRAFDNTHTALERALARAFDSVETRPLDLVEADGMARMGDGVGGDMTTHATSTLKFRSNDPLQGSDL